MPRTPVQKYLNQYAEPEARVLAADSTAEAFDVAVVIPCYGEADLIAGCLDSLRTAASGNHQRLLVIVVVNRKTTDSKQRQADNQRVIDLLDLQQQVSSQHVWWARYFDQSILLIDRNQDDSAFPPDQGVGLARKIGCDCALSLWTSNRIASPWIHTTDGDVRVPPTYLAPRHQPTEVASINVNLKHVPVDPEALSWRALSAYEKSLHYYVQGLEHATSPYAFHTVGSTIVVHAEAYAKVRGFPKRLAGEDFHILNKLAKVGRVTQCQREPILILDRPSDRVPFGTGAAVNKICQTLTANSPYTFYHPTSFSYLKSWWVCLRQHDFTDPPEAAWSAFEEHSGLPAQVLTQLFEQLQIKKGLSAATQQAKTRADFLEAMRIWFDALKHLRFIHILRDQHLPNLPYRAALAQADWWRGGPNFAQQHGTTI